MAAGDDGVPVFVKMCAKIIEDKALKSEGIYRVSGKKEDCLAQWHFNRGLMKVCILSAGHTLWHCWELIS